MRISTGTRPGGTGPAVDLGQPAGPLGQKEVGRAFQLAEVRFELVVACEAQVLGLELVERRTEGAHPTDATEHAFDSQ